MTPSDASQAGWVGVDLDGTLSRWTEEDMLAFPEVGPPIPLMVRRVLGWLADGVDVRIVTARVAVNPAAVNAAGQAADEAFAADQRQRIAAWCRQWLGQELPLTAGKDFLMVALWDDRAIQVIPNTGLRADGVCDAPGGVD